MSTTAPFNEHADAQDAELASGLQQATGELNGRAPAMVFDEDTGDLVPALDFARIKLQLPELARLVKYSDEEPLFDLELSDGRRFPIGGTPQLRKPEVVTDIIADATNRYPPAFTQAKFRPIANALRALAELEDAGASPKNQTRIWIAEFCDGNLAGPFDLHDDGDRIKATESAPAFACTNGCLHLHAPSMHEHLRLRHVRVTYAELTARLGRLGFTRQTVTGPRDDDGKQPQRKYWRSAPGYDRGADA